MEKITLNNGKVMPILGFGTFLTPNGETTVESVRCAIGCGYRHIDTAAIYGNEQSVGDGIQQSGVEREQLFITSKVWNADRGYDSTLKAFEKTLKDLRLDYLDLYLIHWPANKKHFGDQADSINKETWRAFEKLYKEGVVKTIGLSNFMPHHMDAVLQDAHIVPAVDQIEYHPGFIQAECVEYCKEKGIVVEAWSPLGRGNVLFDDLLVGLAEKYGHTVAQLVIRWVKQNGLVPLVKSVTPSRIEENIQVFDFEISQEDMALINGMSAERIGSHPDEADF